MDDSLVACPCLSMVVVEMGLNCWVGPQTKMLAAKQLGVTYSE